MRKILLCFMMLVATFNLMAQDKQEIGVENSVSGIQIGFLGIYGYHEQKLTPMLALRAEVGLDVGVINSPLIETKTMFYPKISMEPRLYYNLRKRAEKGKNIQNNAGNFVSIYTTYRPSWFTIPSDNDVKIIPDLFIAPTWGMKRNLSEHFNYELGAGLGYYQTFAKSQGFPRDKYQLGVNLVLRIGYVF